MLPIYSQIEKPITEKPVTNDNFVRGTSSGASLRASTRGELGSTMLQRSVRSRKSQLASATGQA